MACLQQGVWKEKSKDRRKTASAMLTEKTFVSSCNSLE
jgi:hypothetical protein